jgi:hypothetical protein
LKKVLHSSDPSPKKVTPVAKKPSLDKVKKASLTKDAPVTPPHKICYIKWRDAFTETDEWHDPESMTNYDYICETIGYLIEDNNKSNYYSIAGTLTIDGMYASVINIPKSMIVSKKFIKLN